jgi:EmrB/QacA subfamily drug resistance transporter
MTVTDRGSRMSVTGVSQKPGGAAGVAASTGSNATVRSSLVLAVVLAGTFMAVLDVAIVNVAIPAMRTDLHVGFGAVELVISIYALTYGCLLVTGGRLGDMFGRKRLFIAGMLLFTASSGLCGAAPSIGVLIGARVLQGVGGALMFPQVLAIIQVTFDGSERTRALGLFGSANGMAAVAGQLIGGALLSANVFGLTWRPVFLVNVPIGVLAAAAAAIVLPDDQPEERAGLDWGGVGLIAIALLLLSVPLVEGRDQGWPLWMIVCLACSAPAFAAFIGFERWFEGRGGSPLMRIGLFRDRGFAGGIPIGMLFVSSYAAFLLLLAVYLQTGLGFSPLHSGLVYTPAAVGFFITSLAAPKLVPLLGRHVLSAGYVIAALGLLATAATVIAAGRGLVGWELAPTLFIAGLGQGMGMSPLVGTIIAGLRPQDAGAGAGVVSTTLQTAQVLGIGLGGLLFFTLLGSGHPGVAYAHTYAEALPACALLLLAAALLVHWLPVTPFEAQNVLIERLPGWAAGFAYSIYLATGGRIGERMFKDILTRVAERKVTRTHEAPEDPGEFLAFHFDALAGDGAWLKYLQREALIYENGPVPHETERLPVILAQVDEIHRRQRAGLIDPALDPRLVRLFGFAVASYPRLLPQITRMTTGAAPDDPGFIAEWRAFLRRIGPVVADRSERISSGSARNANETVITEGGH